MKKLFLIIAVASLPAIAAIHAADKEGEKGVKGKEQVVPKGKTYVQLNAKKKEIARFRSGQRMGISDCAKITCPSTFPADWVCWECKERPATGVIQGTIKSRN